MIPSRDISMDAASIAMLSSFRKQGHITDIFLSSCAEIDLKILKCIGTECIMIMILFRSLMYF